MPVEVFNLLVTLVSVVAIIGAATLGRECEQGGSAICFVGGILTVAAQLAGPALFDTRYPIGAFATIDISWAVALGCLAMKHPDKLWPGVAGCFQVLVFTLSASRLVDFPLSDHLLVWASNLASLGVVMSLVVGTVIERWAPKRQSEWDELANTLSGLPALRT